MVVCFPSYYVPSFGTAESREDHTRNLFRLVSKIDAQLGQITVRFPHPFKCACLEPYAHCSSTVLCPADLIAYMEVLRMTGNIPYRRAYTFSWH